jgi:hypothetical protein
LTIKVLVNILNILHFPIEAAGHTFFPGIEQWIEAETGSAKYREIRATRGLRVGRANNKKWLESAQECHEINFIYDAQELPRSSVYIKVIQSLSDPIMQHLPGGMAGYFYRPAIGMNIRFFSEKRIIENGKSPVGPNDIFYSHGIGDKDYWTAERISSFRHVLVPGPAWKERIEKGGYRGEVHIVGYTKLDPLFNGEYVRQKKEKPYVVWAPTHAYYRDYKGRSSYPQCIELIKEIPDHYETALAFHPSARNERDITMQELLDADVVIADAGSTLYEAWALGKPVIFPDWICKKDVLGKFQPGNLEYEIYNKGIGYHAKDMKELIQMIEIALLNGMQTAEIEFMENVFPSELRGKAGETAACVLLDILGWGGCA